MPSNKQKASILATLVIDEIVKNLREYKEQYPDADYYDVIGYLAGFRANVALWSDEDSKDG